MPPSSRSGVDVEHGQPCVSSCCWLRPRAVRFAAERPGIRAVPGSEWRPGTVAITMAGGQRAVRFSTCIR